MPTRRATPRLLVATGMALAVSTLAGGCRWLPTHRPPLDLDPRADSRPTGGDLELDGDAPPLAMAGSWTTAVPLPALPLRAISDAEALGGPAETPHLDAALARAGGIEAAVVEDLSRPPEPRPEPAPPRPLPPVETADSGRDPEPVSFDLPPVPLTPVVVVEPDPTRLPHSSDTQDSESAPEAVRSPSPSGSATEADPIEDSGVELESEASTEPPGPSVVEATAPPAPVSAESPERSWEIGLEWLATLASDEAEAEGSVGPGLWKVRARVLDSLRKAEDAGAAEGRQALWDATLGALAEADAGESETDPPPSPAPASAEPEADRDRSLAIVELVLCRRVEGFGSYEPAAPAEIAPGRRLTLYWEVEGLEAVEVKGRFRTRLASTVEILGPDGGPSLWSQALPTAEDECRHLRKDYYVNAWITPPATLSPGPYRLRMTLNDLVAGTAVTREVGVELAAP